MRLIYSRAVRTVIVGEEGGHNQQATNFISQILDPQFLNQDKWLDDYRIIALGGVLRNRWFTQGWTFQEAALARETVFVYGSGTFHLSDFSDAVDISFRKPPYHAAYEGILDDFEDSKSVRLLDTLKDLFLRSQDGNIIRPRRSPESLLYELRAYEYTDPRDRVYALLSTVDLPSPNHLTGLPSLEPDYDRTNLEVHTDVVMYCTRISGSLDIILRHWADVKRRPWQDSLVDPDLRFVVPFWISGLEDMPFGHPSAESRIRVNAESPVGGPSQQVYCAHNGKVADIRFGVDDSTLTYNGSPFTKGIKLGEIEQLSTRMADGILLSECLGLVEGIIMDDAGALKEIKDLLWQIFCPNRDEKGHRASARYRIALLHLLRHNTRFTSIDTENLLNSPQPHLDPHPTRAAFKHRSPPAHLQTHLLSFHSPSTHLRLTYYSPTAHFLRDHDIYSRARPGCHP
ncbi:uncharacterized protein A1O5_09529 [Cladophialophora psammophila CBS 110553]|uniref:Heterokaryon incompatibility domain-containing protein n=1 Tax=Cladophialophora psammophila CBS 110553 TaxID=1182543 RepID=W9WS82_9EURO|nr:uncharacterized protein A1O5_09529 [Cladophialophora psammophila CBS 110553]EXJ67516.1 hypothetical protein A1O5_09529 [Cladophialophora psammophila CBS 110553]